MEDWLTLKHSPDSGKPVVDPATVEILNGDHQWYATNHAKPTYCNVCRDVLHGVMSHGYSCEICKYKVHKRCMEKAINNCKWTTLASIGNSIIEDHLGNITMPHQWMEGNLPVASKCAVCDKICGSVTKLQDWRCLWCKLAVHTACRPNMSSQCFLGVAKLSVVPPIALHSIGSDEAWDATRPPCCSPLLVFVNSKSGDNQGIKFLRRFKQLLNPAQVFDLIKGGPGPGLRLFRHFDPFRILVCSGDGSVGWVLSEIDRLGMNKQCQVGVLPLGTGNDLARVLGWGGSCDDDANLPHLLEKYEKASTKMLDRWSIMVFERSISITCNKVLSQSDSAISSAIIREYEDTVMSHISNILHSDQESIYSCAEELYETVKDFVLRITEASLSTDDQLITEKCSNITQKLDLLLESIRKENNESNTLRSDLSSLSNDQEKGVLDKPEKDIANMKKIRKKEFKSNQAVAARANSLKKAIKKLVEYTEKLIEEQKQTNNLSEKTTDKEEEEEGELINPVQPPYSPTPNLKNLSPLPDVRRESQGFDQETLPAPEGFCDSRRNSSNTGPSFDFDSNAVSNTVEMAIQRLNQQRMSISQEPLQTVMEHTNENTSSLDKSSPSDDATIKDTTGISADTDSLQSDVISSECPESPSLNSKKPTIKNSESEIDSDILDLTHSAQTNEHFKNNSVNGYKHIDSENSDSVKSDIHNSDSTVDGFSLDQEMLSTVYADTLDSNKHPHNQPFGKPCAIAKFDEGSDIERKKNDTSKEEFMDSSKLDTISTLESLDKFTSITDDEKIPDLLKNVYTVGYAKENDKQVPPAITVTVDPPSPSVSARSKRGSNASFVYNSLLKPKDYMERLSIELPEDTGFSPQATRRISNCSLLKATEVDLLAAAAARFGGSTMSLRHERTKSFDKTAEAKKLPIINPLVRLPMWPNVNGGLISQALLANADALCAAVSPLMDPDETLMEGYFERSVMNNYFGIGIDAKISLDFHHKREEHPEKCRSRAKNYMWYGVLGSKQWLQKTYKNLDQRVQLECDGQRIPLPSLQGIVVLNIPSFMGGTNFWGGTKEGDIFLAPSFDDRVLEVVAVFGSVQMAASRLIRLQHHRIAQCQSIQINILGEEGVPIQVDGEAWVQAPGIIKILHKNRMQMLCRNRALENSLKAWEEKQKCSLSSAPSTTLNPSARQSMQLDQRELILTQEEMNLLLGFIEIVYTLVKYVKLLIINHPSLKADLYQIATRTSVFLEKLHPDGRILQGVTLRPVVTEVVSSSRQLYEETCELLRDKASTLKIHKDLEGKLSATLAAMEQELRKCVFDERESGLVYLQNVVDEQCDKKNNPRHRGLFWLKFRRSISLNQPGKDMVSQWGAQEVCSWLESHNLGEYSNKFIEHDITGRELLGLARRDLKDLGIIKVGHVKRILLAIKDLNS